MNKKIVLITILLEILQENLDDIENEGIFFKQNLKQKSKIFKSSLEENLKTIYNGLSNESQLVLFNEIEKVKASLKTNCFIEKS